MLPQERYEKILSILKSDNIIKINDIVQMFDISIETARRDLAHMESIGLLKRVYGGAIPVIASSVELNYVKRKKINSNDKKQIAIKCSEFISTNDTIFMDTGTTVLEVSKNLKDKKNLTVITNSILVANELMNTNIKVYVLGGYLRETEGSFSGPLTLSAIEQFNVDKAILGAGGITLENGISDYHLEEALVRKKMIERSRKSIVVVEPPKFGINSFASVAPIEHIDTIITSASIDHNIIIEFSQKGIPLVIADN
ncbi:DeoR/GlpR family DNA-binding transcription regulator [Clostridioides difficile]|uniref:DeoR/GlpR transcriptional regulator n=1 Tax=Clostridioides difficile TaxID=1496 RepID=A0A9P3TXQ3_CLODI|nr:DeoR/GlpR family DNA-binding transcription regulator [Clostridioides difficile]MDC0804712.1 DeoR/GlpR family DNA-binding transcription regulator [Clostridium paraputrificum]AWH76509.1 DeoR/GlpR transcriptional regulator [Clostridioides difficile]AWH80284.1 DeoR/GlpR transcriptional regulator [Clostridioides difficile]AXU45377.1 DeoR family transcriptional regulator [Clostridioides difficile]AXU49076.1 DeoR family transcriptional regulator [Clostridioides difficile]